ncbi:asparagine synthase (glutamine-hydrolyzing), partial [bacterium]|nr:asparagine synthase (glutamine-hydrolyzing) [bacterium]
MCGIAGIFSLEAPTPSQAEIEKMTQVLAHRGPDGQGFLLDGPIAFGHRRLSIIDLEFGEQPMVSATGQSTITFNGEIYNYRQLREKMIAAGYSFKTKSDTEVILALYEKHGMDFFQHLSGMFAFALWDRQQKKLILARDRLGVKPLYFCIVNGRLYFASEVKAIRAAASQLNDVNDKSVNAYFTRQYIGGRDTIFSGIQKLLPATALEISREKQTEKKYWQLQPATSNGVDLRAAASRLDKLFEQAVVDHLVSDVPVGVFLSGGVDSSCLLAYGAVNSEKPLNTFSVGFGVNSQYNELEYARLLANRYQTRHHEIQVTSQEALDVLPFIVEQMDEPLADYAMVPTYLMSKFATEKVKVVLSGEGADELFGGYKRYRFDAFYDKLQPLISPSVSQRMPFLFPDQQRRLLLRNFIPARQLDSELKLRADQLSFGKAGHLNSVLYADVNNWLADDLLMKVDKMGMLASLEARVPYLDQQVVEYVSSLPGKLKVGLKDEKRLLKSMAKTFVPDEILQRPKHGFTVPVSEWLRGPLKKTFEEMVLDNSKVADIMNLDHVA